MQLSNNDSESNLKDSSMISQDLSESKIDNISHDDNEMSVSVQMRNPLGQSLMLKSQESKSINSLTKELSANSMDQNIVQLAAKQTSNESKVGKMLSESTQRAVITLVLSMLLSAALLDLQLYIMSPYAYPLGLKVLTASYYEPAAFKSTFDAYIESFEDDHSPVLQVIVNEFVFNQGDPLNDLRPEEK